MGRRGLLLELELAFYEQCESRNLNVSSSRMRNEFTFQALRQKHQRKYCPSRYDRECFDRLSLRHSDEKIAKHRSGGETRDTNLQLCVVCSKPFDLGKVHRLEHCVWLRLSILKCHMVGVKTIFKQTKVSILTVLASGTFASSCINLRSSTRCTRYSCT